MKFSILTPVAVLSAYAASGFAVTFSPGNDALVRREPPPRKVYSDSSTHDGDDSSDFERFLLRFEAANTAFVNGDPGPWLTMTPKKDPASVFGAFGGLGESGVGTVHQRYLLAAGAFRPSGAVVEPDYLVKEIRGKLAYTVSIERSEVLYTGHTERHEQILRATMIFRMEKGAWKIVHRHADDMVTLQLPQP